MVAAYLENFPKIVKFDVVISCLILTEKEGFSVFFVFDYFQFFLK